MPATTKYDFSHAEIFADLTYDPSTGFFTWTKPRRGRHPGRLAGYVDNKGYRVVSIDGRAYFAHRLAWFYVQGVWPGERLDHRNGLRDDNRIANLREATAAQNSQNRRIHSPTLSGYRGVYKATRGPSWHATIRNGGKSEFVRAFSTPLEAAHAYDAAATERHGDFAVLNFPDRATTLSDAAVERRSKAA